MTVVVTVGVRVGSMVVEAVEVTVAVTVGVRVGSIVMEAVGVTVVVTVIVTVAVGVSGASVGVTVITGDAMKSWLGRANVTGTVTSIEVGTKK